MPDGLPALGSVSDWPAAAVGQRTQRFLIRGRLNAASLTGPARRPFCPYRGLQARKSGGVEALPGRVRTTRRLCLSLASGLEATDVVQFETLRPSAPAARARGLQGTPAVSFGWREFCPVLSPSQSLLGGFLRQANCAARTSFAAMMRPDAQHDRRRRAS
jgi:hypothetical protein